MKSTRLLAGLLVWLCATSSAPVLAQTKNQADAKPPADSPDPPPVQAVQTPPTVYTTPPPGTYAPPPTTTYVEPQPTYVPPDYRYYPPDSYYGSLWPFRAQFGIGLFGTGLWSMNDLLSYWQGGLGLNLIVRAHPRLDLEILAAYEHSTPSYAPGSYYDRTDVPILAGMRIHLGPVYWAISPYLAGAIGGVYARALLPSTEDSAWFAEIQGGGGFEIRAGRHFAINLDARGFGRVRPVPDNAVYVNDSNGTPVQVLSNQAGVLFNAGVAVYF